MTAAEVLSITWLTIRVSLGAVALIAVPGLAVAWLLARRRFPGVTLLRLVVSLPMVLPPVAVGLGLLLLLSPRSWTGRILEPVLGRILHTPSAAALAGAVMALPLLVAAAEQAFRAVPRRYEQVARTLGCGPWAVFARITLPLAARGIATGFALAFGRALGEYGATQLVAGRIPGRTETLATAMYGRFEAYRETDAAVLAGVSLLLALGSLWVAERLRPGEKP